MKKEYLYAGAAVICWGSVAPITKLLLGDMANQTVLFLMTAVAAASLLLYNAARGNMKKLRSLRPADYLRMSAMGVLGFFVYNAAYFFGLTRLSAQDACVINYLWPLMTVIFSCIILRERFTIFKLSAAVLSLAGVVIVATKGDLSGIAGIDFTGVLSCLAAAVSYGLFSALNKKYDYDQETAMFVYFTATAAVSGVWCLLSGASLRLTAFQAGGVLWMGVVVSAFGYLIWCLAVNRGDTAKISNLAYITPFLAMILSCLILKEPFDFHTLLGLLLIIAGIAVQMRDRGIRTENAAHIQ